MQVIASWDMNVELAATEQALLERATAGVARYNTQRHVHGAASTRSTGSWSRPRAPSMTAPPTSQTSRPICGKHHAIANRVNQRGLRLEDRQHRHRRPDALGTGAGTPPCETCRHLIWQFGTPETSVILVQYIQHRGTDGALSWAFPRAEKHLVRDLYPYPYEPRPLEVVAPSSDRHLQP